MLGKFLSPDPFIQAPDNGQNYNRYSYVINNPLSLNDPTGHFFAAIVAVFAGIALGVTAAVKPELIKPILAIGVSAALVAILGPAGLSWNPILVGLIAGAAGGAINGGAKGALFGALSGAAFAGVGQLYGLESVQGALGNFVEVARAVTHGVVQGGLAELQGGDFLTGFATASISSFETHTVFEMGPGFHAEELVAAGVVGGTVSELSGGDFANGAVTASMQYLFSSAAQRAASSWTEQDARAAGYAGAAYGDDGAGFDELGIEYAPVDGFSASIYKGEDGVYYAAFRGTNMTSGENWRANARQAFGLSSSQYDQAVDLAVQIDQATQGNVVFVGHSLGGGLASAASYATGRNAITFNAAGLSSRYRTGTPGNIRAHYIRGDILSMGQDFTPLPNAAGTRIPHGATNWHNGPVNRHMMHHFLSR